MLKIKSILLASVMIVGLLGIPSSAHAATTLFCPGSYCLPVQKYLQWCSTQNSHVKWPGPADGKYGKLTKASIISYQQVMHITADGLVGPVTFDKMAKNRCLHP